MNPSLGDTRDTELARCIAAGDAWIKRTVNWDIEQTTASVYLNGRDALGGSVMLVPTNFRPVIHTGGDLVTVTEGGTSLTVAASYDADSGADVYLVGVNENKRCELVKNHSTWLDGHANVTAAFKHGYATVPDDIIQLATEVASVIFTSGGMVGKANKSVRGGSFSVKDQLTQVSRDLIDRIKDEVW